MHEDCIFCKIVEGSLPSTKVYETDNVLAFKDIHPVAPVHILVIPKKHITNLNYIEEEDKELMGELLLAVKEVAKIAGVDKSGFRLVVNNNRGAGQSVFHLHLHVIGGRRMGWPP